MCVQRVAVVFFAGVAFGIIINSFLLDVLTRMHRLRKIPHTPWTDLLTLYCCIAPRRRGCEMPSNDTFLESSGLDGSSHAVILGAVGVFAAE